MYVALFILLFVAHPIKGPRGDSDNHGRENRTTQQVESTKTENTTGNKVSNQSDSIASFPVTRQYNNNTEKAAEPTNDNRDNWNKAVAIATFVLAIVTIWLAVIGHLQYRQSRIDSQRQYDLARETAVKQLRAYITASTSRGGFGELPGFRPSLIAPSLTLINDGQTPAYNVTTWVNSGLRPYNDIVFELADEHRSGTVFTLHKDQSGEINNIDLGEVNGDLTRDQEYAIKSGLAVWFVWGRVIYEDAFGIERRTWFRFMFQWDRGDERFKDPTFALGGNEAD